MDKEYKRIFTEHILNTPLEAKIILQDVLICSISPELHELLRCAEKPFAPDVYISTKSLKHAYDRRPTLTADYLDEIYNVFQRPDAIVQGREGQRAQFIFLKQLGEDKFLACPTEICEKENETVLFCVTFFPARMPYIKKSTILWSREDGIIPPS